MCESMHRGPDSSTSSDALKFVYKMRAICRWRRCERTCFRKIPNPIGGSGCDTDNPGNKTESPTEALHSDCTSQA